jgi:hypothetical protein
MAIWRQNKDREENKSASSRAKNESDTDLSCVYAWVTEKTVLNVVKISPSEADSHSAGQEIP